jgi:DNA mismatch repair protein MutL
VLQRLRELNEVQARMIDPATPATPSPVAANSLNGLGISAVPGPLHTRVMTVSAPPIPTASVRMPVTLSATSLSTTAVPAVATPKMETVRVEPNTNHTEQPVTTGWRFVGLAHGSYALFETAAGLVLLDRRAAHERVWFERLREQFRTGSVPGQRLLLPVPMELDPIAASLLLDRLTFLNAHGFEIAEFGRNFYRVESVPSWMEPADAEPFLRNLLGAFREGRWPDGNPELARDELARLAATKAVRLPPAMGDVELRGLVAQLFATPTPLTSPSGRPTYIELNHGELARRFQK